MNVVNTAIVCPNLGVATQIFGASPREKLLVATGSALQSAGGKRAWIHWAWPAGFTDTAAAAGATIIEADMAGAWKTAVGWVDMPNEE